MVIDTVTLPSPAFAVNVQLPVLSAFILAWLAPWGATVARLPQVWVQSTSGLLMVLLFLSLTVAVTVDVSPTSMSTIPGVSCMLAGVGLNTFSRPQPATNNMSIDRQGIRRMTRLLSGSVAPFWSIGTQSEPMSVTGSLVPGRSCIRAVERDCLAYSPWTGELPPPGFVGCCIQQATRLG